MRIEDRIDAKLDYALEMTFPASDAFTVSVPAVERRGQDFGHRSEGPAERKLPRVLDAES